MGRKTMKVLVLAMLVNLAFGLTYLYIAPSILAAPENKAKPVPIPQAKTAPDHTQDINFQWKVLKEREHKVDLKEKELKEIEKRVDAKIKELKALEASVKKEVDAYKIESNRRIKYLVKMYTSMKPKAAASLMNKLDLKIAVEVFLNMKGDIAGTILPYMDPKKAATITRMLVTYKNSDGNSP